MEELNPTQIIVYLSWEDLLKGVKESIFHMQDPLTSSLFYAERSEYGHIGIGVWGDNRSKYIQHFIGRELASQHLLTEPLKVIARLQRDYQWEYYKSEDRT